MAQEGEQLAEQKPIIQPESMEQSALRAEIVYRVSLGRVEDVAILINQGASVNALSDDGVPLVALAAGRVDSEAIKIIKLLVEAGAEINKADANGENPLFYAAKFGNREMVDYLLSKSIAYGASDNSGNTARSIAYEAGHEDIVQMLDEFVRGKNQEIKQQYEAEIKKQYELAYKRLEERYKAYNRLGADAEISAAVAVAALRKTVYDMSFASCSAAYWQYCNSSHRPTEITGRDLESAVKTAKWRKNLLADSLVGVSQMDRGLVYKITNISEVQIVYQLAILYYNEDVTEKKIGTVKDLETRCSAVAKSWSDDGVQTQAAPVVK